MVDVGRDFKIWRGNKFQLASGADDGKLERVQPADDGVGKDLGGTIRVSGSDGCNGERVFWDREPVRRGDDGRIVVDRQHADADFLSRGQCPIRNLNREVVDVVSVRIVG